MFFIAVVASAALGYLAGHMGDASMRDPYTLLVLLGWLASIAAVLYLGSGGVRRLITRQPPTE